MLHEFGIRGKRLDRVCSDLSSYNLSNRPTMNLNVQDVIERFVVPSYETQESALEEDVVSTAELAVEVIGQQAR